MKKFFAFAISLLFVGSANAGVLFEPYAGYEMGSYEIKTANSLGGLKEKGTGNGTGLGARIAYMFPVLFFLGGDIHYSSIKYVGTSTDPGLTKSNSDATRTAGYLVAGFEFLMGLRAYAGYGVYNKTEVKGTSSTTVFTGGKNMKLGVGYRIIPKFALNFEYITRTYDTFNTGSTDKPLTDIYQTFNDNTMMLSASVPL